MMTPEGRVKQKLKTWLTCAGVYQFWPVQTGLGAATVDCLCCFNGQFVAIETKREGVEKLTKRQELVMKQMRQAGAKTWLVTMNRTGDDLKWIEIND